MADGCGGGGVFTVCCGGEGVIHEYLRICPTLSINPEVQYQAYIWPPPPSVILSPAATDRWCIHLTLCISKARVHGGPEGYRRKTSALYRKHNMK